VEPDQRRAFDREAFHEALDRRRTDLSLKWRDVADATGVSPSTLTRLGQGARPDVDTFLTLCSWASLDPEDFSIEKAEARVQSGDARTTIAAALRSDPNLGQAEIDLLERVLNAAYSELRRRDESG
jgi:transcriptional regulator with XRE-family HTH domain